LQAGVPQLTQAKTKKNVKRRNLAVFPGIPKEKVIQRISGVAVRTMGLKQAENLIKQRGRKKSGRWEGRSPFKKGRNGSRRPFTADSEIGRVGQIFAAQREKKAGGKAR